MGLVPFGERDGHLYYELGGAYFLIFPCSGASGTHDQLGLVVENLERDLARLRSLGIVFEDYPAPPGARMQDGIMHRGHIKAAWFKDTEGNLISLAEFTAGSPFQRTSSSSPAAAGAQH